MLDSQVGCNLSVLILVDRNADNLTALLADLISVLGELDLSSEIIVVDSKENATAIELAQQHNIRLIHWNGYGASLIAGFEAAQGDYILTMDADLAHSLDFIKTLWNQRHMADIVIASRYVEGAKAHMPFLRYALSRTLNAFFSRGLNLHVRDMSSGFRLYNATVLRQLHFDSGSTNILQEILTKAYCEGRSVIEVPFTYEPGPQGRSFADVVSFGLAYLRTFTSLYRLRNSILSADYDDRAYDSVVLPQRYWQRQRFRHIIELTTGQGQTLDVGCGSSRIIQALPAGSIAVDILLRKLRYARRFKKALLQGSGFSLPFADASFPCVLCSQVIEHVPKESPILEELCRVLAPGGRLVLGTPDYANWEWRVIEAIYGRVLPSAYADEHISHYTKRELISLFEARGYQLEDTRYILRGELILAFRKPIKPS